MDTPCHSLERRLERLESHNRRLWITLLALATLVVLAVPGVVRTAAGTGSWPETVAAHAFQLKDADGATRAEITVREGEAGLFILDEDGRDRLAATYSPEGVGLYLKDASGHSRVGLAQFAHGGGGLALHGPDAKGAAVLYFKERGSLRFYDTDGRVTNQVAATADSRPDGG